MRPDDGVNHHTQNVGTTVSRGDHETMGLEIKIIISAALAGVFFLQVPVRATMFYNHVGLVLLMFSSVHFRYTRYIRISLDPSMGPLLPSFWDSEIGFKREVCVIPLFLFDKCGICLSIKASTTLKIFVGGDTKGNSHLPSLQLTVCP